MRRREFLATVGAAGAALALPGSARAQAPRRPNIVIILADDLGYADVGYHGCKDVATPNIDSIAKGGVRFTNGYVSCPLCSPTRAGLMTGRYQQRFGHENNTGPYPTDEIGLPLDQITFADCLKDAGYATGVVGKWHLGEAEKYHPLKRGFDEFFGFLPGGHTFINPSESSEHPILRGTEPVEEKEYLTDAFTREAVDFIRRHREEPFLLYLAYNAVHTPLQAPEKYLERARGISDDGRRTFAAMLIAMDDGVGAVLSALREAGVYDNTLVFFLSDNGGHPGANMSSNAPFRGEKSTVWEGGIRVPFALQWPGRIPAGTVYDRPVISLDILPTAVAAAGGKLPDDRPIDGVDLVPFVAGKREGRPHDALFWRLGEQYAIRSGNLKLLGLKGTDIRFLCDLSEENPESRDIAAERPDDCARLQEEFDRWEAQMVEPRWIPQFTTPPPAERPANATS